MKIFNQMLLFSKKILFLLAFMLVCQFELFCEDWILAAQEFSFSQPQKRNNSDKKAAQIIPQLILEQISQNKMRLISRTELLDRELNKLQTERLSLFLQLSKEYKTRDALVLSKVALKDLEKALIEEQVKIQEIEDKIDQNLKQADEKIQEYAMSQDEDPLEKVLLYKNDSSSLYQPTKESLEKQLVGAKINGFLTGKIISYGEYASVTVDLTIYPGEKKVATITEVGVLGDSLDIARRLALELSPKIANSMPVKLKFDIGPVDAREKCTVNVDGVVYNKFDEQITLESGIHTVTVESQGFVTEIFDYEFDGNRLYYIRTDLQPDVKGDLSVQLKRGMNGIFYARALDGGEIDTNTGKAHLSVNGKSILGVFTKYDENGKVVEPENSNAFFYIPKDLAYDGNDLTVNAKPFNRESNIDLRRRRMYMAYSALICSLPVTFYCVGNFTAVNNAYYGDNKVAYSDILKWQKRSYGAIAVSGLCGSWFVFEMIRYLKSANDVLPVSAY